MTLKAIRPVEDRKTSLSDLRGLRNLLFRQIIKTAEFIVLLLQFPVQYVNKPNRPIDSNQHSRLVGYITQTAVLIGRMNSRGFLHSTLPRITPTMKDELKLETQQVRNLRQNRVILKCSFVF